MGVSLTPSMIKMPVYSYTFPDAVSPSYLPLYLLLAFFIFGFTLMRTRDGRGMALGVFHLFVVLTFFALISLWFFYYQGGTHRFHTLEASSKEIRLFFSQAGDIVLIPRSNIAALTFGLENPVRSNRTWCYLQVSTHSGQRYVSQNHPGQDCKAYRQQIMQVLAL